MRSAMKGRGAPPGAVHRCKDLGRIGRYLRLPSLVLAATVRVRRPGVEQPPTVAPDDPARACYSEMSAADLFIDAFGTDVHES